MAEPIKAGVVGLGRAGWGIHIRQMRERDDFKVVAVADPNEERRKQANEELGAEGFEDLTSMLNGSDAEFIVVATANLDHAKHSIEALEAGRHVLVEKPMATSVPDADAMLDAAKKAGKMLTIHQSGRWFPRHAFVMQMLSDERLGNVFMIRQGGYSFRRRNDWQTLRKYHGGQLNNNGPHSVDQCVIMMQSPIVDVWGDLQQVIQPGDTEDHVKVIMWGENGRVIDMELTTACAATELPSLTLMGTRGSLVISGDKATLRYVKGEMKDLQSDDQPLAAGRSYGVVGGDEIEFEEVELDPNTVPGKSFYDMLSECIRDGGPPPVDPATSRETIRVMAEARKGTKFA